MSSKLFILIVALVVLQQSISAVEFPGIAVKSPFSITTFSSKFPQTCDPVGIYTVCTTCSSTMVCIQGDMTRKACPLDKPYCNNNVCSTTISSEYGCTPEPLKCTGIGFYPGIFGQLSELIQIPLINHFPRSQGMPVLPLL